MYHAEDYEFNLMPILYSYVNGALHCNTNINLYSHTYVYIYIYIYKNVRHDLYWQSM